MRGITAMLATAFCGALLAVAAIFAAANAGLLPGGASDAHIRAYLLSHPELLAQMNDKLQANQQEADSAKSAATLKKIGMAAFFDPTIAFVTGPADAKKSLVEFYDYDCPYCRASLPAVEKFYQKHKNDTRFSFIEFPIPSLHGPGAVLAAKVSLAARKQPDKYVLLHFALMSQEGSLDEQTIMNVAAKVGLDMAKLQADLKDPAIDKAVTASAALAHKAGIDGTPTFIINGVMAPGAVDDETLGKLAEES